MSFKKTNPKISDKDFLTLAEKVKSFKSVHQGNKYTVVSTTRNKMIFVRESTNKKWSMDLLNVLDAYRNLSDFKTKNFAKYVNRTHSPALALLVEIGLLKQFDSTKSKNKS